MTVVLDASYAVDWLTAETGAAASRVLPDLAEEGLLAPVIFWHEVASALRQLVLRRKIAPEFRLVGLRRLRELAPVLDAAAPSIEAVITVSDRHQLTIYDAAYLEMAQRTSSRLATRDRGLIASAPRAGVELVG